MTFAVRLLAAAAFVAPSSTGRADGDTVRGEKKFEECAACHKLEKAADSVGPDLHGVFGRKAAGLVEFRYSPAMKRSGITWTPQTIDKFLTDPQVAVPANRMPYAGMTAAQDRADLIAYLQKTFK